MKEFKVKPAVLLFKWFLEFFNYGAITLPWGVIYMRDELIQIPLSAYTIALTKHEQVHAEQIQRDGAIKFCVKYLWYNLRYGYIANPYELEARRRSGI